MSKTSPIAVLDSGAGGLSVVNALRSVLPHEEIHYFADTANLPYGSKSPELINYLALKMAKKLYELSQCKMMVVACHTISTLCLDEIESVIDIPVIGIVEPSIAGLRRLVKEHHDLSSLGVISTKATAMSRVYKQAWPKIDPHVRVDFREQASGALVSLVEEPDIDFSAISSIVAQCLSKEIKESDAVLIGCTHFSALITVLKEALKPGCHIVDAALYLAEKVKHVIEEKHLSNENNEKKPIVAYVSDNPLRFQIIARRFIEENLMIEWLRNYSRS